MTERSSDFQLLAAALWVAPFPGVVLLAFDPEWDVDIQSLEVGGPAENATPQGPQGYLDPRDSDVRIIGSDACPPVTFIHLPQSRQPRSTPVTTVGKGPVVGLIGENGTGKSSVLRVLAHVLSGSVQDHPPVACLLWREGGVTYAWGNPLWPMQRPIGVEPAKMPPTCNVFYVDHSNHLLARRLVGDARHAEPYHNLFDCSLLACLHRDANIVASASPADPFLDGSSSVPLGEAVLRFEFSEILRQARVLASLQKSSDLRQPSLLRQALIPIRMLRLRPLEPRMVQESLEAAIQEHRKELELTSDEASLAVGFLRYMVEPTTGDMFPWRWWASPFLHLFARNVKSGPIDHWLKTTIRELVDRKDVSIDWISRRLEAREEGARLVGLLRHLATLSSEHGFAHIPVSEVAGLAAEYEFIGSHGLDTSFMEATWLSEQGDPVWLSSGERALWSLVARISEQYHDKRRADHIHPVLVIDEPETSLHPAWQRSFIEVLDEGLMRTNCHMNSVILATHAPLVVSNLSGSRVNVLQRLRQPRSRVELVETQRGTNLETYGSTPEMLLTRVFGLSDPLIGSTAHARLMEMVSELDKMQVAVDRHRTRFSRRLQIAMRERLAVLEEDAADFADPILQSLLRARIESLLDHLTDTTPAQG